MWLMECKPWFAGKQGKPWTPEPQNLSKSQEEGEAIHFVTIR